MSVTVHPQKETPIFPHTGHTINIENKRIPVLARYGEPLVVILGNVLSDEECDTLIELAKQDMKRSTIGATREVNSMRTSTGAFIENDQNETVLRIEQRLAAITAIPTEHSENLHVLRYTPGQEYKAHFDYFSSTSQAAQNNRICTIVLYLNDVEEGGETYFPHLDLSVAPHKGMAVYFEYFYQDDSLNEKTLHGGAPVTKGEKWIATQWIRKQRIR